MPRLLKAILLTTALVQVPAIARSAEVEVMHFWTSGGEASALAVIKDAVTASGVIWKDSPIAGGGGEQAKTALKARITSGNPPTAMLILGHDILDWANEGLLTDLGAVAEKEHWEERLPDPVKAFTKVEGKWVSAPTNVHRVNMVWANKALFDKLGLTPPKTWEEFNTAADKLKAAGITPLAHGGQPWQDMTLFDAVVDGTGGADFYRKAFVDLDDEALRSDTMKRAFDQMSKLRGYVDANFAGRDWNLASSMVINGEGAMQIMGDWAKGEFVAAGKVANTDYLCFPAPNSGTDFVYLVNSLSMFEQSEVSAKDAQATLASVITRPDIQTEFSIRKGSIPAVNDAPTEKMDACAQATVADFAASSKAGTALPTVAFSHATSAAVVGAITDVVTKHFNSNMSSEEAVTALADAVAAARD